MSFIGEGPEKTSPSVFKGCKLYGLSRTDEAKKGNGAILKEAKRAHQEE